MPEINDYSDYDEFKTPALYTITNKSSGTVLDLYYGKEGPSVAINGLYVLSYLSRRDLYSSSEANPTVGIIRSGRLRQLENKNS